MIGLLIYFMIGSIIAFIQICDADESHEKGIMDDEEYLFLMDRKPFAFSAITMFWLPSIIDNSWRKKHGR